MAEYKPDPEMVKASRAAVEAGDFKTTDEFLSELRGDMCVACGGQAGTKYGVPIASDGEMVGRIVGNDYAGEWGGLPCCDECYRRHQAGELTGQFPHTPD